MPAFAARVRRGDPRRALRAAARCRTSSASSTVRAGCSSATPATRSDPITAQGISDAFLDAERIAAALDDVLRGRRPFDVALGDAQRRRDEAVAPMYDFTTQLARLEPPPPDLAQLLGAVSTSAPAMDAFTAMAAGVLSPARFFDPGHLGPLLAAAA